MNARDELHKLVDGFDSTYAKQQLHSWVNEMDEQAAAETLARMRDSSRRFLEKWGFSL
jgi:hypothetical protein